MKRLLKYFVLAFALLLLVSCSPEEGGGNHRVRLVVPSGVSVKSENPLMVADGENAVFELEFGDTIAFRTLSEGSFDPETKTVTLENVQKDTSIELTAENVGYDTTIKYQFSYIGSSLDRASVDNGAMVFAGTEVVLSAGDSYAKFVGWSLGNYMDKGGQLLSEERNYTLELSPSVVANGSALTVYANYIESNIYYIDPNGGNISSGTVNLAGNSYYKTSDESGRLKVALQEEYYNKVGCASLFWDDGSFTKPGHMLLEYNTKPDGTGEGYSLGSKFSLNNDISVLYCIWAEYTPESRFSYQDISIPKPNGVISSNWNTNGVKITGYSGEDDRVVIPEKIAGKPVIAIGQGAFSNKAMREIVLSKNILTIEDGAIVGCSDIERIYYSDSIYSISNNALDSASYKKLKSLYVNATMAPRMQTGDGAFGLKFARFISSESKPRIAIIAGSSTFQGLSTPYIQALFGYQYTVVNFGTTRTTQAYMYLEAMQHYADEDDLILYAPENSSYMFGEPMLYWKTLRDLEGMYNIFRYIDISGYENVFSAFCEFNKGTDGEGYRESFKGRYSYGVLSYEYAVTRSDTNEFGDYQHKDRAKYCNDSLYQDVYKITLNDRIKSKYEGNYADSDPNEDYNTSAKWCSLTDSKFVSNMNRAINAAKSSGAKVYFSFCPVDADKLSDEAKANFDAHCKAYDNLILSTYDFDGILGTSKSYVYAHEYFYNNAFHPNDYGRTYRTYTLYSDICDLLGLEKNGIRSAGTKYQGCLFEESSTDEPLYKVDFGN